MTTFETLVLIFYVAFSFGYMVNVLGIDESDSTWFRLPLVLIALTIGMIWFPIVFGIDIYNKLHK